MTEDKILEAAEKANAYGYPLTDKSKSEKWVAFNDGFVSGVKCFLNQKVGEQGEDAARSYYQLCPKCNGEGIIFTDGTTTNVTKQCDVCNGLKVLLVPPHPIEVKGEDRIYRAIAEIDSRIESYNKNAQEYFSHFTQNPYQHELTELGELKQYLLSIK